MRLPPSLFSVFPLFMVTGWPNCIRPTWQTGYSHLQWWYSSLWHFPIEMTSLMVLPLSEARFLFCPVHSVEETLQQVSHCLSNIFNPIYCSHMSHSVACLFGQCMPPLTKDTHTRTHRITVDTHIQMLRFAQLWIKPEKKIDVIYRLLQHLWVCEDESLRGNKCECKVGAQRLSLSY